MRCLMQERELLIEQLEGSEQAFLKAMEGLSPAQLDFKPSPEVWSARECAEHLAVCEDEMYGLVQGILASPAQPERKPHLTDEWVYQYGRDRTHAASQTSASMAPSHRWADLAAILEHFQASRARMVELARTAVDLRSHFDERGDLDAWQLILIAATHTERHRRQIEALKADPQYPKT